MTYRINPAARLHWASWNDEHVIFDEGSGQTHQMDSVRAFVLNCLSNQAHTADSLVAELGHIPTLADSFNVTDLLNVILKEFSAHGLVEAIEA